MKELTDFLDKYGVEYTIDGEHVLVPGDVRLICPELTHLPESFGNLKIGGGVYLTCPKLTRLPESFGNLKVGGGVYLICSKLTHLPESFGNLKVGGDVRLYCSNLTHLPESFGNLKVGGGVRLYCPWLADDDLTESAITRMSSPTIEADWCFIDGIVREIISRKTVDGLTVLKTPFDFIVGDGDYWAHGKSLEEAIEDYRFKLLRQDPEQLKGLDLDNPMSHSEAINIYRAITGACRAGIRQWMNGKDLPDPITIRQVIDMTGRDYGGREFAEFFEVGR